MLQEYLDQRVFAPSSSRDINKKNFALHIQHQNNEVTKNMVKQLEFYNITSLNVETEYIIKSHDEYTDGYFKLWKSLKDAMPSTYANLVCSSSEILCAAINCIQVLKGRQEKVTVDIKTSLDSEDKSSPIMWNYHKYIAAYYELWNLVRCTMRSYEDLIFLPPQIFCGAIDCIQMLMTKQEVEFQKITVKEYITDPGSVFIKRSFIAEVFYNLWKVLRTMPDMCKIIDYYDYGSDFSIDFQGTVFSPSQILLETIDCMQVLKSNQVVAVTDNIKISLYSQNKPLPVIWMHADFIDAFYEVWNLLKDIMPLTYGKLIFSPLHILNGAIDCIQELKTKRKIDFQKIFVYNITLLKAETAYIIKNHDEYTDAYCKLWKSLKDAMPSTYGNLVCSPSEILCAAINCIQVLKGRQEREVQKATVNIKTSLDIEDKSLPIMWNYHKYIAAYYELWNLVRYTMPSYKDLIFLPPQIFCAAIDCIQMLKTKQEVEFYKNTVNEYITDPYSVFIMKSFEEFAETFRKLWNVLRTMPDVYKIINDYDCIHSIDFLFSQSQILCEAIDCIQVLKSMQAVAVTDSIKISLYSQNKPPPVLWRYSDYINAYYEIWNLLKDYRELIFSPLHILSGAIDYIQELKINQKIEFQKVSADIKTTLCSKYPIIENSEKCLTLSCGRTMPVP